MREPDPYQILTEICSIGKSVREVRGSAWLKAKSKEASGQFPATVIARPQHGNFEGSLVLEVSNLFGGREVEIRIEGEHLLVEGSNERVQRQEIVGSWGGIPLRWSLDLFGGRIPCPAQDQMAGAVARFQEEALWVQLGNGEEFSYELTSHGGVAFPESLRWKSSAEAGDHGTQAEVQFTFGEPDSGDGSPQKWEAASMHGEVKMRWSEREVLH